MSRLLFSELLNELLFELEIFNSPLVDNFDEGTSENEINKLLQSLGFTIPLKSLTGSQSFFTTPHEVPGGNSNQLDDVTVIGFKPVPFNSTDNVGSGISYLSSLDNERDFGGLELLAPSTGKHKAFMRSQEVRKL